MTLTDAERAVVLAQAEREWSELHEAVAAFTDEETDRPNAIGSWSVRDEMLHIANWEEELLRILAALDAGEQPTPTLASPDELDAWNARGIARFSSVPLSAARAYYHDTHRELLARAASSPHLRAEWLATLYGGHLDDLLALRATWRA